MQVLTWSYSGNMLGVPWWDAASSVGTKYSSVLIPSVTCGTLTGWMAEIMAHKLEL